MTRDHEAERLRAMIDGLTRAAGDRGLETLRILQAIADAAPDLFFVKDLEGRYVFLNAAAARITGSPAAEVLGRDDRDFLEPAFAEQVMGADREVMSSGVAREVEEALIAEGEIRTFMSLKAPYRDADGTVVGLIDISRDVTDARRATAELEQARARWQFIVDAASDGIAEWNPVTGKYYYLSARCKAAIGYAGHEDEIGTDVEEWTSRVHPDDLEPGLMAMERHFRGETPEFRFEHRLRTRSGGWFWSLGQGRVTEHDSQGRPIRVVIISTDITAQVVAHRAAAQEALELGRLADEDDLTGVANRRGFSRALDAACGPAGGAGAVHLALVDIDDSKSYNDGQGHVAGDAALRAVAEVLAQEADTVGGLAARLGGDELALLLVGELDFPEVLERVRNRVLGLGVTHDGALVSVSIGGVSVPAVTTEPALLLREADRRLYRAKAEGRNRVVVVG